MRVKYHAEVSLVALSQKMPVPASVILARLRAEPAPEKSQAIEVCRLQYSMGSRSAGGTNGDVVIVIVRGGVVKTAMLRRSWNQEFTPEVLRVDEYVRWDWPEEAVA